MMSAVAVKVLAGLGIAVAGTVTAAHTGFAPGIATALSNVPTWTHAHSVLEAIQNSFASGQHPGSQSGHP
ncbi:MAG TPA: hypothetical protein VKT21_02790 [Thermoplasmata archaeon]|nr:hypothetical protein [Thermoplasmata archaeon]